MGVNNLQSNDPHRFQINQNSDHIMVPFQCDLCHFLNIKTKKPHAGSHQDQLLLMFIIWVILDSFWSRESSIVLANFREANREPKIEVTFGLEDKILEKQGPFPLEDYWGVVEACCVVCRLLDAGGNSQQVQFDTI